MSNPTKKYSTRQSRFDYLSNDEVERIESSSNAINRSFKYPNDSFRTVSFDVNNPLESNDIPEKEVERVRNSSRILNRVFKYPSKNNG